MIAATRPDVSRARRYTRRRKLQPVLPAMGLLTAWGGAAQAGTLYSLTSSTTITVAEGASLYNTGGSLTLERASRGAEVADLVPGSSNSQTVSIEAGPPSGPDAGYFYAGVIDNGDGTSDLVLSFPGDGAVADGVVWTSLFVDNLPPEQQVFEPLVIPQLASSPVFDPAGGLEPGTQLERLDAFFPQLLRTPYGDTATLIAFNGPGNTGTVVGTITIGVVPEPATGTMALAAGALATYRVRRRRA
ncbi:MAG: hypothetical protein AAF288_05505 [Planctomycetota bacterium]